MPLSFPYQTMSLGARHFFKTIHHLSSKFLLQRSKEYFLVILTWKRVHTHYKLQLMSPSMKVSPTSHHPLMHFNINLFTTRVPPALDHTPPTTSILSHSRTLYHTTSLAHLEGVFDSISTLDVVTRSMPRMPPNELSTPKSLPLHQSPLCTLPLLHLNGDNHIYLPKS